MLEVMFTALSHGSQRREVARGLAELPLPALIELAENKDGRALLERALAELKGDLGDGDNRWAADQIGTALKTVDFKASEDFKKLDSTSRQTILERLGLPVAQPGSVDTLIGLAKSPGFHGGHADTRRVLLSALAEHAGDAVFSEGLQLLAGDPAFKKLTPTQQASAIGAFKDVAASEAYQGHSGKFGVGGTSPSKADKRDVLDNARLLVVYPLGKTSTTRARVPSGRSCRRWPSTPDQRRCSRHRLRRLSTNDSGFQAINDAGKQAASLDDFSSEQGLRQGHLHAASQRSLQARWVGLPTVPRCWLLRGQAAQPHRFCTRKPAPAGAAAGAGGDHRLRHPRRQAAGASWRRQDAAQHAGSGGRWQDPHRPVRSATRPASTSTTGARPTTTASDPNIELCATRAEACGRRTNQ